MVRGPFSPARAWRPAVFAGLAQTLESKETVRIVKWLKSYSDPRLRRKIAVLRAFFLVLETAVVALILAWALTGDMLGRSSLSGARADSRAVVIAVRWSESPTIYVVNTLWHLGAITLFIVGCYLALAKIIEKLHGRPLFRRKYPY